MNDKLNEKMKTFLLANLFVFIILSACTTTDSTPQEVIAYASFAPGSENVGLASYRNFQLTDEGFFIGGSVITFHDFSAGRGFVVCPQPGCAHVDGLCPALVGPGGEYALYQDTFYAMTRQDLGIEWLYTFKSRNQTDNLWQTHWEFTFLDDVGSNVVTRLGGGYAVILVNEFVGVEHEERTYNHIVAINLTTGTLEEIVPRREMINWESYLLSGAAEGKAVLFWTGFDKEIILHYDFLLQAIEDGFTAEEATDDWFSYLEEHRLNRILAIDLGTGYITEVASSSGRNLHMPSGMDFIYRGVIYYYYYGSIMSHNLSTGVTSELLSIPNVVNIFAFDGRVFYIINVNYDAHFYYYVLETGEIHQLYNQGNREVMVFSIHHENSTMFKGFDEDGWGFMLKEDFYAEYYYRIIRIDF